MAAGFLLCSIDQMLRPATLPFHGERVTVRAGSLFIEAWLSMAAGARTAEIAGDPFGPPTYVELPAADAEAKPAATAVAMINFKGNMTFLSIILNAAREAQAADEKMSAAVAKLKYRSALVLIARLYGDAVRASCR